MRLIDLSVQRPVTVWVGVILVVLFGVVAYTTLPVQMRPTVDKPEIRVETDYKRPGVAPPEVEQQVTNKIEEQLASVEDMKRLSSVSREGRSEITLEFEWGVDKNIMQLNVQKKLNQVEDLPDDAKEPVLKAVSSDEEQPIMWVFAKHKEGTPPLDPFETYRFIDEKIRARFERVPGVGDIWLFGGPEREIRIVLDYERMSAFGITVNQVRQTIQRENLNLPGGALERGKRRETARTVGQFQTVADIANVIVAYREGRPITIRDFAEVKDTFKDQVAGVRQGGQDTCVVAIIRRTGTNTLEVVKGVEDEIERVNTQVLANLNFEFEVLYKDSTYIEESLSNVQVNVAIGGVLATLVLLVFLRSARSTLIIAFSIPICIIATFIFIKGLDRTLNIVSLAGLGFAVGMVVDSAIVVLENCFRHMEEGEDRATAARNAGQEVWGAVLASSLTTMAVFLPIVFLEVEAGQLFKDIAIAVAFAVGASMVVSITLIPMLCSRWLKVPLRGAGVSRARLAGRRALDLVLLGWFGRLVGRAMDWVTRVVLRFSVLKLTVVLAILIPCGGVFAYVYSSPQWDLDYLPAGNRNFIFGLVFTPPGSNMAYVKQRCYQIEDVARGFPEIDRYFTVGLVGFRDNSFMGVQAHEECRDQMDALRDKLSGALFTSVPGLKFPPGIVLFKMPVFQEAMGGKSVEVNLTGNEMAELATYSEEIVGRLQPIPGQTPLVEGVEMVYSTLDVGNPERRVVPDRQRCADLGFHVSDIADLIGTLVGGSIVDTYKEGGDEFDITLVGPDAEIRSKEDLENFILQTASGDQVTLRDVADVVYAVGPTKVEHIDQDRSVTVSVQVRPEVPLQRVVDGLNREIVEPLRKRMPSGYTVSLYGTADRLAETKAALAPSFILAVLIVYLLMASLFESFVYPFVIMFTVPLSWAGAYLGIFGITWAHHALAAIDAPFVPGLPEYNVLTLLGFVILTGVVVNNAILIVHQSLNLMRSGSPQREAIRQAVRQRVRPIFMSTITSVLGMMPLALGRGSGAELYNGIGAAVVGGLALSAVFTLILTPAAFSLFLDIRRGVRRVLGLAPAPDDAVSVDATR